MPKNPRSAKQSVTLTGLGISEFDQYAAAFIQIHGVLANCLPHGSLRQWKPLIHRGHATIECYNRYFSGSDEADDRPSIELDREIDPFGILLTTDVDGVHTEDNVVQYMERRTDEKTG